MPKSRATRAKRAAAAAAAGKKKAAKKRAEGPEDLDDLMSAMDKEDGETKRWLFDFL